MSRKNEHVKSLIGLSGEQSVTITDLRESTGANKEPSASARLAGQNDLIEIESYIPNFFSLLGACSESAFGLIANHPLHLLCKVRW